MTKAELEQIFAGANDSGLLCHLFYQIRRPRNEAQRLFCQAMEVIIFVNSDGFESMLEQCHPPDYYANILARIGLPELKPIFDQVTALIPERLRDFENDDLHSERTLHIRGLHAELRDLLGQFFDATTHYDRVVGDFVRTHQKEFEGCIEE